MPTGRSLVIGSYPSPHPAFTRSFYTRVSTGLSLSVWPPTGLSSLRFKDSIDRPFPEHGIIHLVIGWPYPYYRSVDRPVLWRRFIYWDIDRLLPWFGTYSGTSLGPAGRFQPVSHFTSVLLAGTGMGSHHHHSFMKRTRIDPTWGD